MKTKRNTSFVRKALALLTLALLCPTPSFAKTKSLKIYYMTSGSSHNTYWLQVFGVMNQVAASLDIELVQLQQGVRHAGDTYTDQLKSVMNTPKKPDAIILSASFGEASRVLKAAEEMKIPVFLQGPLFPQELLKLGSQPRALYKNWIGYFHQREFDKSRIAANTIIAKAREKKCVDVDGKIHILALAGVRSWYGYYRRESGLQQALSENPDAVLDQTVSTNYSSEQGGFYTNKLIKRYPKACAIWASGDQLALSAVDALEKSGFKVGKNYFVGSVDLTRSGVDAVSNGQLSVTVASGYATFIEVLVKTYDYLNGHDFMDDSGSIVLPPIVTADDQTAVRVKKALESLQTADFRYLSKVHNKKLTKYDFTLETLSQLPRRPSE
ncbi:MAG: hypothetical protein EOP10_07775 [Proteobacteria bacterium]|nr:MAG: hypothetical protein EOP10_07775 [Pseudomonadota bacterium]